MKLRCLVIDDEPMALDILADYIKKRPSWSWRGVIVMH